MSQHDMTLDNASGLVFRTDANAALQALASQSSGPSAPSPTFPCQVWGDTGTGRLKQRNAANSAWLDKGPLDAPLRDAASQGEFVADTGAANAYVCNFIPAITARSESTPIRFKATNANTGACTINDGIGTVALVGSAHSALQGGEIFANGIAWIQWNTSVGGGSYVLLFCTGGLGQAQLRPPAMQSIAASVASNALTLTWNPQSLTFRNPTLTSGTLVSASAASPLTLTIPSTATLGTVSGQQAQLVLLVAYNGGTPVLCVSNIAGGVDLSEAGVISPTTISAGATSAGVIYSASAVSAGSPYRVVGYIQITEATAGTWATAATLVQGAGGQALAAMQSFGYGQTVQSFTIGTQRVIGTTYVNTTSKPIQINAIGSVTTAGYALTCSINGGLPIYGSPISVANAYSALTCVVPPGATYVIYANGSGATLTAWSEIR